MLQSSIRMERIWIIWHSLLSWSNCMPPCQVWFKIEVHHQKPVYCWYFRKTWPKSVSLLGLICFAWLLYPQKTASVLGLQHLARQPWPAGRGIVKNDLLCNLFRSEDCLFSCFLQNQILICKVLCGSSIDLVFKMFDPKKLHGSGPRKMVDSGCERCLKVTKTIGTHSRLQPPLDYNLWRPRVHLKIRLVLDVLDMEKKLPELFTDSSSYLECHGVYVCHGH
jgi:hypothetical protein